jgi:U5 small nuclear ribonucleoprotein component
MFMAEIHCPQDCLEVIYSLLLRRRAHVTFNEAKPGSPLSVLRVEIPGMETFGFETDLRSHTMG